MAIIHRRNIKRKKKDLNDPDNHDDMVIHLSLCVEIKWALGSIITNKTSRGDRIPVELFQILKDDVVKVMHSNASKMENQ